MALKLVQHLPVAQGTEVVARLITRRQQRAAATQLPGARCTASAQVLPGLWTPAAAAGAYWVYRLTHGMPPAGLNVPVGFILEQAVDQALLDAAVAQHKHDGHDFTREFQCVADGGTAIMQDPQHKLKTASPQDQDCFLGKLGSLPAMEHAAKLRRQPQQHSAAAKQGGGAGTEAVVAAVRGPEAEAGAAAGVAAAAAAAACVQGDAFMDRGVLLAVAEALAREYESCPPAEQLTRFRGFKPRVLLAILRGDTDAQSVACAQYWLACKPLQQALRARGFVREAVVMRTLIEAFEAVDESGLSTLERALRMVRQSYMLQRMLGNMLFTARVCRGKQKPTLRSHVNGFTMQTVLSLLGEGARLHVLQRMAPGERGRLCERSLGSDHCEGHFATVVGLSNGGKPTVATLKGMERRLGFVQLMKQESRADRRFSIRKRRTRGGYKEHGLLHKADRQWNSAAKILATALSHKRQGAIQKRAEATARGKCGSLRAMLFNKAHLAAQL
ncbi:hypothetical protein TSOC_014740 [Tetrabaena socialis]|uniref:Uncharacterized protein n=1 Tax=Tetrabaena socialis TaxID=47790 RepID=A0A2J7ZGT3_9CHLO|nr:hypothetical protein TSOC_014740 [Tetrabaena socialis]|eukprot:PNG99480.1 hypothetical protein TSOC_014740 [Tetrabaena socialis]